MYTLSFTIGSNDHSQYPVRNTHSHALPRTKTAQRAERRKGLKADKVKDKDEDEKEEDDEDAGERTGVTIDRTKEIPIHKRTVEESDIGGEHSFYYTCLVMCLTTILVSFAISEVARYMYGMQHWLADGQGITLWCIIIANVFVFVLMITMQVEFVMNATGTVKHKSTFAPLFQNDTNAMPL